MSATIIPLSQHLERRLMAAERRMPLPSLHHEVSGLKLSTTLHKMFGHLVAMADATKRGKAPPDLAGVAIWRIAECIRDGALEAAHLERKLRKAKKRAKKRG